MYQSAMIRHRCVNNAAFDQVSSSWCVPSRSNAEITAVNVCLTATLIVSTWLHPVLSSQAQEQQAVVQQLELQLQATCKSLEDAHQAAKLQAQQQDEVLQQLQQQHERLGEQHEQLQACLASEQAAKAAQEEQARSQTHCLQDIFAGRSHCVPLVLSNTFNYYVWHGIAMSGIVCFNAMCPASLKWLMFSWGVSAISKVLDEALPVAPVCCRFPASSHTSSSC